MKKQIGTYFLIFDLLAMLTGCGTAGFPRQSYNPKNEIKQLETIFEKPELIPNYYALISIPSTTEDAKKAARNNIIDGRLALINLNYDQFIAQFSVTKQSLDFSAEVVELGLNLATTAAGGETTKTILGAVSSGVTGGKLAIDKNFFFEKTVPVLVTTMNAQRKVALASILIGLTNNTDIYPLTQALADIDAYYFAGTFVGALQAIQSDSGAKEKQAETNIMQIRDKQFATEANQNRVKTLLGEIDKLSDVNAIALEKNPPVKDTVVDNLESLRDPTNKRLTDANIAKQMLKMRAVMGGKRSEDELSAWEAAVKSTQ